MSYAREIIDDPITTYLKTLFENNKDLSVRWKDYQTDSNPDGVHGKEYRVYTDLQEELPYTPAIEISPTEDENNIFSIGTQEEKFNFSIICTVALTDPENTNRYCRIFAKGIFNLLNSFENRSFQVPGYDFCVYYSEATNIRYNFRRGKSLRSCSIEWYCKLLKPNRTTSN